jgi:hypothetical protein
MTERDLIFDGDLINRKPAPYQGLHKDDYNEVVKQVGEEMGFKVTTIAVPGEEYLGNSITHESGRFIPAQMHTVPEGHTLVQVSHDTVRDFGALWSKVDATYKVRSSQPE